jgi:2-dehydro-3-deoxygluconokinase
MSEEGPGEKRGDAVSLGETMLYFLGEEYGLLRYNQKFEKFVGGTESNTLISLAKLGFKTGWVSRLGEDEFGINIRNFVRGHGVDVSRVALDPAAPTGVFFVEKNANDENRSFYYRAGSAATRMNFAELDLDYITGFRMLHLTGITAVLSDACRDLVARLVPAAKNAGMIVSFDPNLRLRLAGIERFRDLILPLLPLADIFLPTQKELELLMDANDLDSAIDKALRLGSRRLVIKRGASGALSVRGGSRVGQPAYPLKKVVSSMAAGDAFNAGYAAAVLMNWEEDQALRLANCLGAMAASAWGPNEGIPDREQIFSYFSGGMSLER